MTGRAVKIDKQSCRSALDALKTLEMTRSAGGANPHLVSSFVAGGFRFCETKRFLDCPREEFLGEGRGASEGRRSKDRNRGENEKMTITAKCEECGADIAIPQDAIVGEIVAVQGVQLRVRGSLHWRRGKVTLKKAEVAEEDWGE